jgi:GST-like protein
MYTLYGFQGSGSAAVEMALELADLPFKIVDAASWEPNSSIQELETINPLKQIPTLVLPDGSILTESAAILIHLGLTHPASGILPTDSMLRAQAIRGLVYISANCYSAIGIIDYPERWLSEKDDAMKENVRNGTVRRLHANWDIFAAMFPATSFLGGDEPNALDFLAVVVSSWSGARAHLRDTHPDFFALLERVELHATVASVYDRHWRA